MRTLRIRTIPATGIAAALILLTPSVAHAHHLPTWGSLWLSDSTIVVRLTQSWPNGEYVGRIDSAIGQWNGVGTTHSLSRSSTRIANYNPMTTCGAGGTMNYHWADTATYGFPAALGFTGYCSWSHNPNDRGTAEIVIDKDRDWYTGTGDANDGFLNMCLEGCQMDLWSILSHEQAHGMGFDHFLASDSVCGDNNSHHTMCPTYKGGTERDRTYEIHEKEKFNITY